MMIFDMVSKKVIELGMDIIIAVALLLVGRRVIRILQKVIDRSFERANIDLNIRKFLGSLIKVGLYAILISVLAALLGIDTTSFIAVLGSAGLAVGLALQGSLANFAGGVLILVLKPFLVNDYIVTSGVEGKVEAIDLFYTSLMTGDNKKVTIPNGTLANTIVTNVTAKKMRRLDMTVTIGYQADMKKIKTMLEDILNGRERLLKENGTQVFVDSLGENTVVLGLRAWVMAGDYLTEKWEILEQIKLAFDAEGIEIPYNQMEVHLTAESARTP